MRYVVLVADGMADRPIEALGGRTPLEAAKTPNIDLLATCGEIGLVRTMPEDSSPGPMSRTSRSSGMTRAGFIPGEALSNRRGWKFSSMKGMSPSAATW